MKKRHIMSAMTKIGLRVIKSTLSRYFAIALIIALGSGFFTGLKVTTTAMIRTIDNYLTETNMYDARVISGLGWSDDNIGGFEKIEGVKDVEGSKSVDFLALVGENETVLKAISLPAKINLVELVEGRMPVKENECVIDSYELGGLDIGGRIVVAERNDAETLDSFVYKEYEVVGSVRSPLYINFERGTTTLGSGSISGFVYVMGSSVNMERYTDMYITYDETGYVYSEEYDNAVEAMQERVENAAREEASRGTDEIYALIAKKSGIDLETLPAMMLPAFKEQADEALKAAGDNVYVLGRKENIGYYCYRNDADIVDGIAAVFPIFFFAVAALVCLTTMNRMVVDDRTRIGVLKSLGYGSARIMSHYLIYAGSAAIVGGSIGVFAGSIIFPKTIWNAYTIMYSLADITVVFDPLMMTISGGGYLLLVLAVTYITVRSELKEAAAELIRPKAPQAGKRVLMERIGFIWKRLKFLHKVSVRNVFRYKKRLIMMILGIGGCMALLVTGFGLDDSISHIADRQFKEITFYDCNVTFSEDMTGGLDGFLGECGDVIDKCTLLYSRPATCTTDSATGTVTLMAVDSFDELESMVDFHNGKTKLAAPGEGECFISKNLSDSYELFEGDDICVKVSDKYDVTLKIVGVYENVIYNYVYATTRSVGKFVPDIERTVAYINFADGLDVYEAGAKLSSYDKVISMSLTDEMLERVNSMLDSMKYVVLLVISCAAALDFIVLFNLTNINILERIREIATIKVLGFKKTETSQYVFRENLIMTLCGAVAGIPLGILLHNFVMSKIKIDLIAFESIRSGFTYGISIVLTFVFTFLVNLMMRRRLSRINMAEALKSVE
ncbi:MAG: ABC transporter permease [Lachnospiraceae bacterium]|nr:ABC transporter permease [Lachnospiraceae bacterium]